MHFKFVLRCLLPCSLVAILLTGTSSSQAQTKQLQTRLEDLAYLETSAASPEDQRIGVAHVLSGIEFWLKLCPEFGVALPAVPPQPWNAEQTGRLIAGLRETVQSLLAQNAGRPFKIGAFEISVTAETSPLSLVATGATEAEDICWRWDPSIDLGGLFY
jgi:hypothetical protein